MSPKRSDYKRATVARGGKGAAVERDAAVERAVAVIPGVGREASIDPALEIGQLVFERVFGGDGDAMRRRGRKDVSFRKLAKHPAINVSASKLWACCAIYELSERWPALRNCRHLVLAHVRCVLGLRPSEQKALLARAEKGRWSVSKLAAEAVKKRRGPGGRPRKAKVVRMLDGVRALLVASPLALRDAEGIAALTPLSIAAGLEATAELREKLAELEGALQKAGRALDVPPRGGMAAGRSKKPRRKKTTARRSSR